MSESSPRCQCFVLPLAELELKYSLLDLPPAVMEKVGKAVDLSLKLAEKPARKLGRKILAGLSLGSEMINQTTQAVSELNPTKLPDPIESLLYTYVHNKMANKSEDFSLGAGQAVAEVPITDLTGYAPLNADLGLLIVLDTTNPLGPLPGTPNGGLGLKLTWKR